MLLMYRCALAVCGRVFVMVLPALRDCLAIPRQHGIVLFPQHGTVLSPLTYLFCPADYSAVPKLLHAGG
jgi:hypothetical protein